LIIKIVEYTSGGQFYSLGRTYGIFRAPVKYFLGKNYWRAGSILTVQEQVKISRNISPNQESLALYIPKIFTFLIAQQLQEILMTIMNFIG
jgi:hypothetical protein